MVMLVVALAMLIVSFVLEVLSYGPIVTEGWVYFALFFGAVVGVFAAAFRHPERHVRGTRIYAPFWSLFRSAHPPAVALLVLSLVVFAAFEIVLMASDAPSSMSLTRENIEAFPEVVRALCGASGVASGWAIALSSSALRHPHPFR